MAVKLEDKERAIKGAHHYLVKHYPLQNQREVYELLGERGSVSI